MIDDFFKIGMFYGLGFKTDVSDAEVFGLFEW